MAVRQDEAVGREDNAGSAAALPFNADHGRTNLRDGVNDRRGIGVQESLVAVVAERVVEGHGRSSRAARRSTSPE
jgi:hypothetical protein